MMRSTQDQLRLEAAEAIEEVTVVAREADSTLTLETTTTKGRQQWVIMIPDMKECLATTDIRALHREVLIDMKTDETMVGGECLHPQNSAIQEDTLL